jgi:hypothetical protein
MESWSVQLLTLLGVIVGVIATFASSAAIERTKWQRDQIGRWEERRLECYGDFADSLKRYITISHRIAAHLGLPASAQPIVQEEGIRSLATINDEISAKWEQMLLIGSASTIDAARKWRKQVRLLDSFTHGHNNNGSEWLSLEDEGVRSRMNFYEVARADLAIKQRPSINELPYHLVVGR